MLETLGQYRILDRLGTGGLGEVYRARDTRLGRTVAIKVLPDALAADFERRERLLREARAAAALSHPNVAALYEVGEDQGRTFLVFEFVPGDTLTRTIAEHPLNPRHAIDHAIQIADALAEAHAEGIVHRDVKPDKIVITPKGSAKILDFGLSTWTRGDADRKAAVDEMSRATTAPGSALRTIAYMSPEQALGEQVDHRTDIFSLGVVLFEMLTGRQPFTGSTASALTLQIVQAPAPAPSSVNPSVPREVDPIVAKALAKDLARRYEAAATMAAELRSVAALLDVRSGDAEPASVVVRLHKRPAVWPKLAWLLLVLLGAGAAWLWFSR